MGAGRAGELPDLVHDGPDRSVIDMSFKVVGVVARLLASGEIGQRFTGGVVAVVEQWPGSTRRRLASPRSRSGPNVLLWTVRFRHWTLSYDLLKATSCGPS
jgi:hypothetical protein